MSRIKYKSGYKYQLVEDYKLQLKIRPATTIKSQFIKFTNNGELIISFGYAWDGPSGPTFDTKDFMRGSLIHDVLYQLIREKHLSREWRYIADNVLYDICREDKMPWLRAIFVYWGVRIFGRAYTDPKKDIKYAP